MSTPSVLLKCLVGSLHSTQWGSFWGCVTFHQFSSFWVMKLHKNFGVKCRSYELNSIYWIFIGYFKKVELQIPYKIYVSKLLGFSHCVFSSYKTAAFHFRILWTIKSNPNIFPSVALSKILFIIQLKGRPSSACKTCQPLQQKAPSQTLV